jgi:cytochrome c oxidase subunit 2
MTLIYIIAFVFLCIAAHQLFRVVELARSLKNEKEYIATESDNRLNARLFLLFMFVFFAFSVWQLVKYVPKTLPQSASDHGVIIDDLMLFNFIIVFVVFYIVNAILFIFAFRYYGRKDSKAVYYPHNNKLEMIWTVVPAIALAFIIIFGLKSWNDITAKPSENALKIELYSKQFDWTARYAGADNTFGVDDYRQVDGSNPMGLDTTDNKCYDDIIIKNEIHIPVGREVVFQFRSRDVIHSAYMPHFRAQMNCVPGQVTYFKFTPIFTTAQMRADADVVAQVAEINAIRAAKGEDPYEFDYVLLCNKICGASHYNMQMKIVVDTEAEYKAWIDKQKTFKNIAQK